MSYYRISEKKLREFVYETFKKVGFTEQESKIITDVILLSDLYGIESHGVQRFKMYHDYVKNGMVKKDKKAEVVYETPVSATIDACFGMGQIVGHKAMEMAIEKAKASGIGIVTVKNSNHYGIAGYYAKMASNEGYLGLSFTNSGSIMVPTNGRVPMLGSNPIACAMPAEPVDFLFDASTTVVTHGKLEVYKKLGKDLPEGWALDERGKETRNPGLVVDNLKEGKGGGILPLGGSEEVHGGHKGYGYGMIAEIFTSILSLGMTSNYCLKDGVDGCSHGFIAIDPGIFGDRDEIKEHFSEFLKLIRESSKAEGSDRIYTHGEKEIIAMEDRLARGILVNEATFREIKEVAESINIDFNLDFETSKE